MTQTTMFLPAHRAGDHQTSITAAKKILPRLSELHEKVLRAMNTPKTDKELERLPEFSGYGFSTIRKRRSELFQAGRLEETGNVREGCKEWRKVGNPGKESDDE